MHVCAYLNIKYDFFYEHHELKWHGKIYHTIKVMLSLKNKKNFYIKNCSFKINQIKPIMPI